MRDHLTADEVAAYANRFLDLSAEHEIDGHVGTCEHCLSVLINSLWDRLERSAGQRNGSVDQRLTAVRQKEHELQTGWHPRLSNDFQNLSFKWVMDA